MLLLIEISYYYASVAVWAIYLVRIFLEVAAGSRLAALSYYLSVEVSLDIYSVTGDHHHPRRNVNFGW